MSRPAEPTRDGMVVPPEVTHHGRLFWVTAAIGGAGIAWGIHGIFAHGFFTRPSNLAKFFVIGVVVHDAIFAPLVLVGGVVVARVVPAGVRAWVQAGFIIGGSVFFFAYPEIRDFAAPQHNPTSLPYNYTANTIGVVVGVTLALALVGIGHHLLVRRRTAA